MFIEIIATSYQECQIIEQAGNISRIELCTALEQGGLTPPYDVIKESTEKINIPIRVMVRHRDNDFYCPDDEYLQIKKDIAYIKTTKAEGIVVGILTPDHHIDLVRMQELVTLAHPLAVTFHRAFDLVIDKITAVQQLAQLGVKTILTQGGTAPIIENLAVLQALRNYGIQIQGGSGINLTNYQTISQYCDAIHLGSAVHEDGTWATKLALSKLQQLS
ncbi:copper homeostasis protein CutC [Spiroplasma sp. SV19]|uniref:copper homeostasis protein CutC n=1 Tax=Spiroplasma sp. SV19 TaxID=2570468 RepID=UPI0024B6A7B3|nr:copper homeostasis protein CutC [Spiroplasma sp. SV19]WHQ37408.1 copper homeostasis protein [Spiroplasma sp. SV19]